MEPKPQPIVANQARYLKYYAIFSIISSIASVFISLPAVDEATSAQREMVAAPLTNGQLNTLTLASIGFGVLLSIILSIYLLRSRNLKAVQIWLIILLAFAVFGIVTQLTSFSVLPFAISAVDTILVVLALRQVRALSK